MTTYDPVNLASFFQHYSDTETLEKSLGAKIERYMDDLDAIINDMLESWALKEVADITALRALYEYTLWDNSATQHITRANQIRKVISASDGTNTFKALYWFVDGATDTDADGATGNVDTDGIVAPLVASGSGRWFRIGTVGSAGGAAVVHQTGIEALRTMLKYLYINLTDGSSDVALTLKKRTAGSQIKILTDEVVAIRNLADSAYEDFAALAGTFAGAVSGTTGTFSGAVSGTTGTFSGAVAGTTGTFSAGVSGTTGTFTSTGSFGGAVNMNSQRITSLLAGNASGHAVEYDQMNAAIASASPIYGDGSDGAATISSNTTLTAAKYYSSLTIDAGFTLTLAGFPIFVNGTLTWNGTINSGTGVVGAAGDSGNGGAGGAGGANTRGELPILSGGAGGAGGGSGHGTAGTAATVGTSGTAGAAGGAGAVGLGGGTAGNAGAAGAVTVLTKILDSTTAIALPRTLPLGIFANAGAGGGGGGGTSGAGGGGGGAAGQTGLIVAKTVVFGGSSVVQGVGGAGGAGGGNANGNGAGGGGGSGSIIFLVASSITGSVNTTTLTGGAAGAAGATGSGGTPTAASAGTAGRMITVDI